MVLSYRVTESTYVLSSFALFLFLFCRKVGSYLVGYKEKRERGKERREKRRERQREKK